MQQELDQERVRLNPRVSRDVVKLAKSKAVVQEITLEGAIEILLEKWTNAEINAIGVKIVKGKKLVRFASVTLEQIISAFEEWDKKPPEERDKWVEQGHFTKAVRYKGKCYPLKPIMRIAIGLQEDGYTVERTQIAFKELGLEVIYKSECG